MASGSQNIILSDAGRIFLESLSPEGSSASQQKVHRFVRWFGQECPFAGLTAPGVAAYAEQLSLSDTDYLKNLEQLRAFLAYAKKKGWGKINLATSLKIRRTKPGTAAVGRRGLPEAIPLTREGYAGLQAEIAELKQKRPQIIEEIRLAAADKDFRENAPLAAAREQRGHIEGRIKELEEMLKVAVVIDNDEKQAIRKVSIGDRLVLHEVASGEELRYMIVAPREADPLKGKISNASPLGKALIGKGDGDEVEVKAPAGNMRYRIKKVER